MVRAIEGSGRRPSQWRRAVVAAMAVIAAAVTPVDLVRAAPVHPLEPLTAEELATVGTVLKRSGRFSADTNFAWIELQEPPKSVVQAFKPGADFPRLASLSAIDFDARKVFAVVVDLKTKQIVTATQLDGLQPGLTDQDIDRARAVLDADPRVKAALVGRGLSVPGKVSDAVGIQFAPVGHDPSLAREKTRLMRAFFASDQHAVNDFSPFVDGLMVVIDLYAKQVIRLVDVPGVPQVPVPHDIFDRKVRGAPARGGRAPRAVKAPAEISVRRNLITWRNWQFRYGFNLREGLVLYQLAFNDRGRMRPILYRASVSEVVAAYGDATDFWSWMELFDEGVYGLGASAAEVRAGREVPADARVLDPVLPDSAAAKFAARPRRQIYLYERDAGGLLYYQQGNLTFHAHATELVVGFVASLGNYAYGFNWVFRPDGSFAFEAELAGEVLTKFVQQGVCEACKAVAGGPAADGGSRTYTSTGDDRYGTLVYPNLVAANHQHWFSLRLDFDVDGAANAVMENNLAGSGRGGPHGSAPGDDRSFSASHTVFGRSADGTRDMDDASARTWTIYNPNSVDRTGHAAGYTIVPMDNTTTAFPAARAQETVGFTFHHFWVTPYRPGEIYAAGRYPNQAGPDYVDTLSHYADNESVYDKDIVVWYSLGMTHFPRPEDYPIMSNERLSVAFRPEGFFERNPALGLGQVSGH